MNSTLSISQPFRAPRLRRGSSVARAIRPPRVLTSYRASKRSFYVKAVDSNPPNEVISYLKSTACALVVAAAAFGKFHQFPARADIAAPSEATLMEEIAHENGQLAEESIERSPLAQLLESNPEAVNVLKKLLQEKLEAGEDEESLSILRKLSSAEPNNLEWRFLTARVLNESGKVQEAREAFEDILAKNPLSFEALFENALLMDRSGEREAVMSRLEQALRVAEDENKTKEARDVKLIMAQMQFLHKNVEEALQNYDELIKEDPSDFRPYFCKGMIYSLMDKNVEAREQFAKYRELSPKKFEVEGYLRTPLSRMKLFGTDEED